MPNTSIAAAGAGKIALNGSLTVDAVARLLRDGRRLMAEAGQSVVIDLGGVERADSAGLALLVDWLAWAQQRGQKLEFTHMPTVLQALAGLSEIQSIFVAAGATTATQGG
jgi:phospholipid transport system transporter-binding protein